MINTAVREDLETPFDRQRAVSLLEEATQFLKEYSGGSAVLTQSLSGENSVCIQPAGSHRNEPHSSQRLQANHTRLPRIKTTTTTTTASSVFTHQNRKGNINTVTKQQDSKQTKKTDITKEQVPVARYQNSLTKEQVPKARCRNAIKKLQFSLA